ncbi:Apyrase [Drechslerella dactyloides]|uniref:type I protein arginine methyltransferase n=1 Tax=Drechslerella dactyloides TaxID=74499 RepID=A0AAD6IPY9_DREDA|nr:Apyrase [Drechslerella dactyloides]
MADKEHGFDWHATVKKLGLDFYGKVKLVNYLRKNQSAKLDTLTLDDFASEEYLQPALEDDPLLLELDDEDDEAGGVALDPSAPIDVKDHAATTALIQSLTQQIKDMEINFASYKKAIAEDYLNRVESSDVTYPQPPKKKDEDSHYFESYSGNDIHETMLKDTVRTESYRDFIYDNKHIFQGKTVLDVGCGTGILSMFCARAGAAKVFAVDNSDIIDKARENVFENDLGNIITCIRGKVEEITLPVKKVDIIVSEWMGYCLLYEAMLDSVLYARDKYLAPDGLMVPSECRLMVAAMHDSDYMNDNVYFWNNVYGFRMSAMKERVREDVVIAHLKPESLASEPVAFLNLPLHTITAKELVFTKPFEVEIKENVESLDAFVVYFDNYFATSRNQTISEIARAETWNGEGLAFTTGPGGKETHWRQGVLIVQDGAGLLKAGQKISGEVSYKRAVGGPREVEIEVTWETAGRKAQKQLCMGEVIYSAGREGPPDVRILHFNDVYNIGARRHARQLLRQDFSSREPVGGAARFISLVKHYRHADEFKDQPGLLVFFSGDAYNPSLESTVTKGKHMPPILNAIGIDAACAGNHDFDYSPENFAQLAKLCKFPWLAANLYLDGKPIGDCKRTTMVTTTDGIKVGVIGLVEEEWIATVNSIPPNVEYRDAATVAKELVPKLREEGAEMVVCVSHAREPNDVKLANELPEGLIDIVYRHDHHYAHQIVNGIPVLRSGTDFKNLSYLTARRKSDGKGWDFDVLKRDITSEIQEDEDAAKIVNDLTGALKAKMEKPIGITSVPLDSRFIIVRTQESNIGNFACDVMRYFYNTDCTLMASGTIRGDCIYEPGLIRIKDLLDCFPFQDPCVVIRISGKKIIAALENGFSKVPALEGRFPQVSGMTVTYDPDAEPFNRVREVTIGANHEPIELDKLYTMATRDYMQRGKEGNEMMADCEVLVSAEAGLLLSTVLRQYFLSLKVLGSWASRPRQTAKESAPPPGAVPDTPANATAIDPAGLSDDAVAKAFIVNPEGQQGHRASMLHHSTLTAQRFQKLQQRHKDKGMLEDDPHDTLAPTASSDSQEQSQAVDPATQKLLDELKKKAARKWGRLALGRGLKADNGQTGQAELGKPAPQGLNWCKGIRPMVEGRIRTVKGSS